MALRNCFYKGVIFFTLLLFASVMFGKSHRISNHEPQSYAKPVQRAAPAVVNIYTLRNQSEMNFSVAGNPQKSSLGSGVIMNREGYILTNNHVVRRAKIILVALVDGRRAQARVIGVDPQTDLALLKINMSNLQPVPLGDSEKIQVGDVVLAIGNPFGLGQAVTQGIISAIGRTAIGLNSLENYIQTDAAINPGNSGGALVNTHGKLIGINTGIYSRSGGYQGVGFAIPSKVALNVMNQLIKYGYVKRAWLGVTVATIAPDLAQSAEVGRSYGVVVTHVIPKTPAERIGLQRYDIITSLDNHHVQNSHGFLSYIAQLSPGTKLMMTVWRGKQRKIFKVILGMRPTEDARQPQNGRDWAPDNR